MILAKISPIAIGILITVSACGTLYSGSTVTPIPITTIPDIVTALHTLTPVRSPGPALSPNFTATGRQTPMPTVLSPTEISATPGLPERTGVRVHGHVKLNSGSGLADVKIYLSLAAYPGEIVATTDDNGDFQSDSKFIPGDENVTVWAELEGYYFDPPDYRWRHYHGFEERALNFSAKPNSSISTP